MKLIAMGFGFYSQKYLISSFFLLQIISGVRLTDTALKRTYDFDDLAQVFVMQKS